MAPKKRRRVALSGKGTIESTSRWGELPREIVAMIASYTCTPVEPLPFTCLARASDSEFTPYRRQEDRASALSAGGQFALDAPAAPSGPHYAASAGATGAAGGSTAAASNGASGGSGGAAGGTAAGVSSISVGNFIPGTFRPVRMSETALAMRCVCRLWCEVLSEGVRRIELHDTLPVTLSLCRFPRIGELSLGSCTDFWVRQAERLAAAADAPAGAGDDGGGSRRRRQQPSCGASRRGSGSAAAAAAASGGGGSASASRSRSLAGLTCLRDLQVMDSAIHLDLAASCGPSLEELAVVAQQLQLERDAVGLTGSAGGTGHHYHHFATFRSGLRGFGGGGGGVGGRRSDGAVTRRSALDRTLSSLPGLRRLRLHGLDASAARLGSALMGLQELTSLRLLDCQLPTFFAGSAGGGGARRGGGGGRGGRGGHASFAMDLMMNLGSKLRDLSLQGCYVRDMPDAVLACLTNLRWLDLSYNMLSSLPPTLTLLVQLEYLDLQHNILASLPEGVAALSRLADLDLSENHLHRLPGDFSQLTSLTFLHLGGLHSLDMAACCPLITPLTNLHSLGLYDVDLTDDPHVVPPNGGGNPLLANPLAQLAAAFGPVGRLRELVLDGCGLDSLPPNFSDLTSLSHLSVTENFDATTVPEGVTSLRGLVVLKLGYLDLSVPLPAGLFDLGQLRELDLEQNFLPGLQPDISKLTALQVLNLVDCFDPDVEGEVLPWPQLYSLTRLRRLGVSGQEGRPQRVKPGIGALTGLEDLDMRHVDLPVAVLEELCHHARDLTSLDISSCGLRSLPQAITRLTRLEAFELTRNNLARLPAGFGAFTRLTDLGLSYNTPLSSLPPDITRLTRLRCLSWSVGPATAAPSREQLGWMSALPELVLHGRANFAELAKQQGIAWTKRSTYY